MKTLARWAQGFKATLMGCLVDLLRKYSMRRPYIHGSPARVKIGKNVSLMDTILNVSSGDIYIGDNTIFGHGCMLLTGVHEFEGGMRKRLFRGGQEAPLEGHDIVIGSGCWIASGAIVTGGVSVGDNTIVAAGAVVTKNLPDGVFAAGIPARVIRSVTAQELGRETPTPLASDPQWTRNVGP